MKKRRLALVVLPMVTTFALLSMLVVPPGLRPDARPYRSTCMYPDFVRRAQSHDSAITLVLHGSMDRVNHRLAQQVANWGAPVSLAVIMPPIEDIPLPEALGCLARRLAALEDEPAVGRWLSVHLVVRRTAQWRRCQPLPEPQRGDCRLPPGRTPLQRILNYPANVVRNVARRLSSSEFILLGDTNQFFSEGFEGGMRDIAQRVIRRNPKITLTFRFFEVDDSDNINLAEEKPLTRATLRELLVSGKARQFEPGHRIERLQEWLDTTSQEDIQFIKTYTDPEWEPQFVSNRNIPFHDENFLYPFKDNAVQKWEMCRAGYSFAIANRHFGYHNGFKNDREKAVLEDARSHVRHKTLGALARFNDRMDMRYHSTARDCPVFDISR